MKILIYNNLQGRGELAKMSQWIAKKMKKKYRLRGKLGLHKNGANTFFKVEQQSNNICVEIIFQNSE